jgi:hypothetical protein
MVNDLIALKIFSCYTWRKNRKTTNMFLPVLGEESSKPRKYTLADNEILFSLS